MQITSTQSYTPTSTSTSAEINRGGGDVIVPPKKTDLAQDTVSFSPEAQALLDQEQADA
ncbi:hypothetical protein [Pseudoalteromonas sp.]|uniref:hypothetical protein n=1 Tax=Pseudoalteromonas sp. TaxID=53249 RepID=UPI00272A7859|nr:hypothetical protein [Pseudoalteromonas sp.]